MDTKYKGDHVCICFWKLSSKGSRNNHSWSHRQWVRCRTLKPLRSYKVWEFLGHHLHVMLKSVNLVVTSALYGGCESSSWIWCACWCLVIQSCPTLCGPMDWSPWDCSAHGILQARILETVAISLSRGSSQPRDQMYVSCIAGGFFTSSATWEAQKSGIWSNGRAPEATLNSGQNVE